MPWLNGKYKLQRKILNSNSCRIHDEHFHNKAFSHYYFREEAVDCFPSKLVKNEARKK